MFVTKLHSIKQTITLPVGDCQDLDKLLGDYLTNQIKSTYYEPNYIEHNLIHREVKDGFVHATYVSCFYHTFYHNLSKKTGIVKIHKELSEAEIRKLFPEEPPPVFFNKKINNEIGFYLDFTRRYL